MEHFSSLYTILLKKNQISIFIFQDKFELCMRKPLQLNITKLVWVVTILPTALMALNILTSLIFVKEWKLNNSILFITIFGIINLTTGYFYINCHIFRNISKDINQRIMVRT